MNYAEYAAYYGVVADAVITKYYILIAVANGHAKSFKYSKHHSLSYLSPNKTTNVILCFKKLKLSSSAPGPVILDVTFGGSNSLVLYGDDFGNSETNIQITVGVTSCTVVLGTLQNNSTVQCNLPLQLTGVQDISLAVIVNGSWL